MVAIQAFNDRTEGESTLQTTDNMRLLFDALDDAENKEGYWHARTASELENLGNMENTIMSQFIHDFEM